MEYSLTLLIVMWCKVTHHPSLNIVSHFSLLCDVKSHRPPFMEYSLTLLIVMWCKVTHHPSLNIVSHFSLLCDVKSHTTLYWINFVRNSEDCFPTSFDNQVYGFVISADMPIILLHLVRCEECARDAEQKLWPGVTGGRWPWLAWPSGQLGVEKRWWWLWGPGKSKV